jgi:exopolysaccharide biosynthesis polyprenyl glycosylphosphotransferase
MIVPFALVRMILLLMLKRAPLRRHVAVVGANHSGYEMVEALRDYGGEIYEFVGYFDDAPNLQTIGSVLAAEDVLPAYKLDTISHQYGLDQIVLANPVQTPDLLRTVSLCHERGIQVTPMFALYQDLTGRVPVSHLGNNWFVAMPAHVKSTARTYLIVKRMLDIMLASVMLLLAAPFVPFIALAIKLDSPGPVFFTQTRIGMGGKLFKIFKFRSMHQDAEAKLGAVWAEDRDPRITRVGRFLRKSRLDEVPQLWNLLVGDMSFVGPRPERPEFEEELERQIPFYRARRAVRPGLTGWAQVRHGYGNTMFDALRKVEYDLYYIKNESLYLDLLIILRTVAVVLRLGGT